MAVPRRLWDSNIVIGYLAGYPQLKQECELIIAAARRGELEIVVSTMAEAEVAYLDGESGDDAENKIREFFNRNYVIPAAFDRPVAAEARSLVRMAKVSGLSLKPPDAVHLATCAVHKIPTLETTDPDLLRWDEKVGDPPIKIRPPRWEGPRPFSGEFLTRGDGTGR